MKLAFYLILFWLLSGAVIMALAQVIVGKLLSQFSKMFTMPVRRMFNWYFVILWSPFGLLNLFIMWRDVSFMKYNLYLKREAAKIGNNVGLFGEVHSHDEYLDS